MSTLNDILLACQTKQEKEQVQMVIAFANAKIISITNAILQLREGDSALLRYDLDVTDIPLHRDVKLRLIEDRFTKFGEMNDLHIILKFMPADFSHHVISVYVYPKNI